MESQVASPQKDSHQGQQPHPELLSVTIIVNGQPTEHQYPGAENVRAIIVGLLSPADRPNADQYMLTDSSQNPPKELNSTESLMNNGVKSGHLLSLTKRDGGGGQ